MVIHLISSGHSPDLKWFLLFTEPLCTYAYVKPLLPSWHKVYTDKASRGVEKYAEVTYD